MEEVLVAAISKNSLVVGVAFGLIGCIWGYLTQLVLLTSDSGAIQMLNMLWLLLHLPVHLVLWVLNPPIYLDGLVFPIAAFVQWFVIGWCVSSLRRKWVLRKEELRER